MTTTLNNSYLSNPVIVAQGGTGKTSFTAYSLLAAGTTSTGILQNAATGTSSQLYLSAGSAALGAWTNQDQLGAWQIITSTAASSSATISFTGLSATYYAYKIIISALVPQTNATNLWLLVSSNNGVSYDNSAGNYEYISATVNDSGAAATTITNSSSAAQILVGNVWSNTSFSNNLEMMIVDPATSSNLNGFFWQGKYDDSTAGSSLVMGIGSRKATQVNNAIRFQMSSGNIVSGTFTLYGILA